MENEKKATTAKVEVQKENELIESGFFGITIKKDPNYKTSDELTREDLKQFPKVLCEITSKFIKKNNSRRDSVLLKVYPFVDLRYSDIVYYLGKKSNVFYDGIRLNEDNKVRFNRTEYVNILYALGLDTTKLEDSFLEFLRYARFTTGISPVTNGRYYRMQLFLTERFVISLFFNPIVLDTISRAIKSGVISPITFIEPSNDDVEFKNEKSENDLNY